MVVDNKHKQTEKVSVVVVTRGSDWIEDIFVVTPHQQHILLYLFS